MGWLGVADNTIKKLAIEAMRHEESDTRPERKRVITFKKTNLPKNTHTLEFWLEKYIAKDLTEP